MSCPLGIELNALYRTRMPFANMWSIGLYNTISSTVLQRNFTMDIWLQKHRQPANSHKIADFYIVENILFLRKSGHSVCYCLGNFKSRGSDSKTLENSSKELSTPDPRKGQKHSLSQPASTDVSGGSYCIKVWWHGGKRYHSQTLRWLFKTVEE